MVSDRSPRCSPRSMQATSGAALNWGGKPVDVFLAMSAEKTVSAKKREKTAHKFIVRVAEPVILRVVAIVFRRGRRFDPGPKSNIFYTLVFRGRRIPTNETTHISYCGLAS